MPVPGLDPPASYETWLLVDWIEATMVLEEQPWSRTGILDGFASGAEPDQAEMDLALAEIARRRRAMPTLYPFEIEEQTGVLDRTQDSRVYDFLVLLSFTSAPYRAANEFNTINPMFDLLVREGLKHYLGEPDAQAIRFGWPVRDGRPESLVEATPWLAAKMGLGIVSLAKVDDDDKDAGVDVVGWKPFAGGGGGFTHLLMQNTVQLDFRRKPGDILTNVWLQTIDFGTPPPVGMAVPFAVDTQSKTFELINAQAHVIFDRLRLCQHLEGVDLTVYPEWADIADWNKNQKRALLQSLQQAAAATQGRKRKPKRAMSTPTHVARPRGFQKLLRALRAGSQK
jgi:hypothetical protein